MADRTNEHLILYKKDGTKVLEGIKGSSSVTLTGLAPGTSVAAGDYTLSWADDTDESSKVPVPAFTVLKDKVADPTNITATATTTGSNVTAE